MKNFLDSEFINYFLAFGTLVGAIYALTTWAVNNKKQIEINKINEDLKKEKEEVTSLKREVKEKSNLIENLEEKLNQQKIIETSNNKKLIVHNKTDKMRFFFYTHLESGNGSGYPISPKDNLIKELKGNSYKYSFYGYEGSTNSSPNEKDVLGTGEFNQSINGYKVIVLDK